LEKIDPQLTAMEIDDPKEVDQIEKIDQINVVPFLPNDYSVFFSSPTPFVKSLLTIMKYG
jgi:hypothetical protein